MSAPTRASYAVAVVAAAGTALALSNVPFAAALAALGAVVVTLGGARGSRPALVRGTMLLGGAVALGALLGAGVLRTLLGAVCACVAWDTGRYGFALGEQTGREARTERAELAHAAVSLAVGTGGGALAYAAYALVPRSQPVASVLAFLVGGALLAFTLRPRER